MTQALVMATNPFYGTKRSGFTYKPGGGSGSDDKDSKRRRIDPSSAEKKAPEAEELWDESVDFTQAELDDIDIIASQAYCGDEKKPNPPKVATHSITRPSSSLKQSSPSSSSSSISVPDLSKSTSSSISGLSSVSYPVSSYSNSSSLGRTSSNGSRGERSRVQSRPTSGASVRSDNSFVAESKSDTSSFTSPSFTTAQHEQLKKLQSECANYKSEADKAKDELYGKEGEIKILREKLQGHESELQQFQEKRIHDFDQQKRQQSEAEKALQSEVLSLQTQLHFQEKELNDMKEQYRLLVQKGHNPTMIPMSPVVQSKRPKAERDRQDDESGFPSERSFLESMALQAESSTQTSTNATEQVPGRCRRRLRLTTSTSQGQISGSQLISRLLDTSTSRMVDASRGALLEILTENMATKANLAETTVTKIQESHILSLQAMDQLLNHQSLITTSETCSGASGDSAPEHHMLNMLPLMSSVLSRYCELLDNIEYSVKSLDSSLKSSTESSSLGAHSNMSGEPILEDKKLEELAGAALRVLHLLCIHCPSIWKQLIASHSDGSLDVDRSAKTPSDKETSSSSEVCTSSGNSSNASQMNITEKCGDLLGKVIKLATPNPESDRIDMVKTALDILLVISSKAEKVDLERLVPALCPSLLFSCLSTRNPGSIIDQGLQLLTNCCHGNKVQQYMGHNSDECLLLRVSSLCVSHQSQLFQKIVCLIGTCLLTDEFLNQPDCRCNEELIHAVVQLLYAEMQTYQQCANAESLGVLRSGMSLLHNLHATADRELPHHDHSFVALTNKLSELYKTLLNIPDMEESACHDLCHNDDWDMSPGDDTEDETMEVS